MKLKVSIIMPVLNGERYIGQALASILAQTYNNYELIVVNDGSTDRTVECVAEYTDRIDIKLVHHSERKGVAASVNDGIRHATGDCVTFLDHDDAWLPHMLETQTTYLEQHPEAGMVYADFQTIDPDSKVIEKSVALCRGRTRPSGNVFRQLFLDSFIVAIGVLIRKECLDRLGGFDESLLWGDYHLWLRIARNYEVHYIPKVVAQYRQHNHQCTRSVPPIEGEDPVAIQALQKILEAYPETRRELGETVIRQRMASVFFGMAYYYFEHGAFDSARRPLSRAIALWPLNIQYRLLSAATLMTPSQAAFARRMWHRIRSVFSTAKPAAEQWQGGRVQGAAELSQR
jgi:glycosyltransferase involved in cell wall biosynthesis